MRYEWDEQSVTMADGFKFETRWDGQVALGMA